MFLLVAAGSLRSERYSPFPALVLPITVKKWAEQGGREAAVGRGISSKDIKLLRSTVTTLSCSTIAA